ncbi:pancreatic triacylglycerol lipase-like [Spodoptera litura]|uniref:Pancreatic triacylglycerol lipase-like n=1 Tax=Spodoptera litura TaxID=69820 RepID=A0A9J7IP86_SPOLT|nr:pancreatic triacylglycerol lipase-like [Spodoptera litura]
MNKLAALICLSVLGLGYGLPNPLPQSLDLEHLEQYATYVSTGARYDPTQTNVYHLFTRDNPVVSQPLILNNPSLLQTTNYRKDRRTIVLIHGWLESVTANFNSVLIPVFLAAEDVNIIVVDWSIGASSIDYRTVIRNTITSGEAVGAFINWVNRESGATPTMYHIVGHGFGGHQAGIVGRNVDGDIAYITALDPAFIGWVSHPDRFDANDGQYTEVIHTNYGINGYLADLGHVDFYPNGGISMPGCDSHACDHARSYFYFAESITSGGFTGRQCLNYFAAIMSSCDLLPGRLEMGGLRPKIGRTGVYLLETNASPPFSQG